ncbi:site-2 protease family protein [Estrella lausannensis]|uniref:Putative zinc metalloprotease n=1 Tax=Estrella lausannensis TaxID=483423 RepID=A0A0H5E6X1_9BACT|nr:site-2 protease family protein [Estrella lausannensis]CRX39040.1 Putative zinc metalloprotease [Estrella lausannensis]
MATGILLALLCLSFLIFIHELGHYVMARLVGMRVETFAIGFGRPLYSWDYKGTKWQIGWLPFGGFVKIAGQEVNGEEDPYSIPDGFFGKSPLDRIKVALAGPLMNLLFAFLLFTVIWSFGGREKNFSEFTPKIGWIDPKSELYASGIRPGDEIVAYGNQPFSSFKDHLYAPMTASEDLLVQGNRVDYLTGAKKPFSTKVKVYPHPNSLEKGIMTAGILQPANYIIYDKLPGDKENPLPEGSPLEHSGIQYGDRIFWVDGEIVFSMQELNKILNDERVFLIVQRDGKEIMSRVPLVELEELRLDQQVKDELTDWQYEAGLGGVKPNQLKVIPYNLTSGLVVEGPLRFIDKDKEKEAFPEHMFSKLEEPLLPGDRIIAVQGEKVRTSSEMLKEIQRKKATVIIQRKSIKEAPVLWRLADAEFEEEIPGGDLKTLVDSLGQETPKTNSGSLYLLSSVIPKKRSEFTLSDEAKEQYSNEMKEALSQIERMEDPEKRAAALNLLENRENQLLLGLSGVQDRRVNYNPNPVEQFKSIIDEIYRTLYALVTGTLNPKWMSGPIGIVQVMNEGYKISSKEALYWMAFISLNLGVINLLPIPVLDGGTIVICLFELLSGKKIKPKTLEKLIVPFAVLLIVFFVFLTYHDLARLFKNFLPW